jgi:integrase
MPLSVHLHDLRHTFATLQLSAGVHYMQLSKWLGHSPFSLTLDVYGDYINDDVSQPAGLARPIAARSNVVPLVKHGA